MKPYYDHKWITIYCGDCRKILPTLPKVDLVLTDPPYGINGGSGTKGKLRSHKSKYITFEDTIENIIAEIVPRFNDVLSICSRAILTPGPKALTCYPAPDSVGCLYQPATVAMQKWGRADSQPIFYYGRDPRLGKTISFCSFKLTEASEKNGHPCSKPIKIWMKLLQKGSLEGETILDPFMGSGTTLVAAKNLGRKAIGIEIEEKYCEIAVKRLAQEALFQRRDSEDCEYA